MIASSTSVVVDRVSLAVKRMGRGAPVVCLSAIGHDAADFEPLAARVTDSCELICLEWPGHGRSGPDHQPVSARRYAELLTGVLETLQVQSPVIIGNSIGGAVAIRYAARHPVQALVLCDSAGLVEITPTVRRICGWFERFFAAGERGAAWYSPLFALYYRIVLPQKAARSQRQSIIAHAQSRANVLRQAWASFSTPEADLRAVVAGLDMPIWIAWAASDYVIPLRACLPAIRKIKRYTLDTFAAGHSAFLEQPDEFAKKFRSFLADIEFASSARNVQSVAA